MADLAYLGLDIDSRPAAAAAAELDRFAKAGGGAAAAADKLAAADSHAGAATDKMVSAIAREVAELGRTTSALVAAAAASNKLTADLTSQAGAHGRTATAAQANATATAAVIAADASASASIDKMSAAISHEIAALSQASGALAGSVSASAAASAAANKLSADLAAQAAAWARTAAAANENERATKAAATGWSQLSAMGGANLANINASRAVAQMNTALAATGPAAQRAAGGIGLAAYQMQNLVMQGNDVVTMLVLGAPLFQIFASQAGQIYQVLSHGQGGVIGSLRGLGSALLGLASPINVAVAGLAGMGLAAAGAYIAWERGQDRLATSIRGVGRAAGLTLGDLNRLSEAGAAAAGISQSAARNLTGGFVATGKIGGPLAGDLTGISRQFSRATGTDLTEGGETLARAFASPTKGADLLNERLGFLDGRTKQLIATMEASGDTLGAQRVLFDALASDLATVEDRSWRLGRAFENLGRVGSDAFSGLGAGIERAVNGPSAVERLRALRTELDALRQNRLRETARVQAETGGMAGAEAVPIDPRFAAPGATSSTQEDSVRRQAQALETVIARAREMAAVMGDIRRANAASIGADAIVRSTLPAVDALTELETRLRRLREALADPSVSSRMGTDLDAARIALDALGNAVTTFMTADERARASEELSIRSINARTAAEQAAIAADRERLQLAGQKVTAIEAETRAQGALNEVMARAARAAEDALRSANDDLALSGLRPYQRSRAEIEQRARDARERATGNPEALVAVEEARRAQLEALDRNTIGSSLDDATRTIAERAAALRLQAEMFGKTAGAIAEAETRQRLLNDAMRQGVEITPQLSARFDEIAAAAGRVAQASEELAKKQQLVVDAMDEVRSTSSSTLGGIARDLAAGKSGVDALRAAMGRIGEKLIDSGTESITKGLFGEAGKPGGGLFGDGLGKWIGQAVGLPQAEQQASAVASAAADVAQRSMAIGTATITAGTVTVMGYAPASGGLPFPPFGGAGAPGLPAGSAPIGTVTTSPLGPLAVPPGVAGDGMVPRTFPMPGGASLPSSINMPGVPGVGNGMWPIVPGLNTGDRASALDDAFEAQLRQFMAAGQAAGHDIGVNSSFRTVQRQAELYQAAVAKYGPGQRMVAPPGRSNHNFGVAADLSYGSPEATTWAHENAGDYGLRFPMSWEDWHVEPQGLRTGGYTKPTLEQAAINAQQGMAGGAPVAESAPAIAQAAQAAQTATTEFQKLGSALGATAPQATSLGSAVASMFSGAGGGAPPIGGLFSGFAGLFGSQSSAIVPVMHDGGIVGAATRFRSVNDNIFAGAPRYHGGGLADDEVPAVLRRGEGVFTREQMAAMGGGGSTYYRAGDTNITVEGSADKETVAEMRRMLRESERRQERKAQQNAGPMNRTFAQRRG